MAATRPGPAGPLPDDGGRRPAREAHLATVPSLTDSYARVLGAASRAVVLRRRPGALPGGVPDVPDLAYVARGVRPDTERLSAYQRLLGLPAADTLPAGFVHVLAFPVATALLVREDVPLPALGLVHLRNHVVQSGPLRRDEPLTVRAWARDLAPHRRGTCVEVLAEVGPDGGAPTWRGVSTYLARGVWLRGRDAPAPADVPSPAALEGPATARWDLGADVGRRYAAVSGDRNPLHLWALTARPFGFRRAIAHGMYLAARALGEVAPAQGPAFTWDVAFESPVLLPGRADVRVAPDSAGWAYAAWDARAGRRHLSGAVVPLR